MSGRRTRDKGKRGEREVAALLRAAGYDVRRGWQARAGSDEADIIGLPGWHIEVGYGCTVTPRTKLAQSCADAVASEIPVAVTRGASRGDEWIVSMRASDWMARVVPALSLARMYDPDDQSLLVMSTLRYALGRHSYMVAVARRLAERHAALLSPEQREQMAAEVDDYVQRAERKDQQDSDSWALGEWRGLVESLRRPACLGSPLVERGAAPSPPGQGGPTDD